MAQVIVTESSLQNIAGAIRSKLGTQDTYTPSEMAGAISQIHGDPVLETLTANANSTYTPSSGKDGFSQVVVNVPNSYSSGDEGKVVSGGALVAQSSQSISANGQYDTTLKNQVNVSVPNSYSASDEGKVVSNGALVAQSSQTITDNGTYDTTLKNQVIVNVSGGGSVLVPKTITQNGTYNPASDNADGYSQVVVNVSGGGGGEIIPDVPSEYQKVEYIIFGPNDENQFIRIPQIDAGTEIHCKYRALAFGEKGLLAIHHNSESNNYTEDFELYNSAKGQSPTLWERNSGTVTFDEIKMESVPPLVLNANTNNFDVFVKLTLNISMPIEGRSKYFFRIGSFTSNKKFKGYCYYVSFKNKLTDSYVKFLVPCYRKADNVIGFYDTVNDVFYTNEGSGDFGKGADA